MHIIIVKPKSEELFDLAVHHC